jgi:hypothetical protein
MGPGLSLVGPTVRMRSRTDPRLTLRFEVKGGAEGTLILFIEALIVIFFLNMLMCI